MAGNHAVEFGIPDQEPDLGRECDAMWAFQTCGLLAVCATHNRFDFVRFQVDAADRMIFGIDDQNALLIVDHQAFRPIECCLEWVAAITRVSFFSRSGNMLQGIRLTNDSPNAVTFSQCDPDELGIDRQRSWPE